MSAEPNAPSKPGTAIVAGASLVTKFAEKYNMEPEKLSNTLKATCFRATKKGQDGKLVPIEISNEQMAALLIVADQYGLNPFTRELYAFPHNGGIVPIVSIDGWIRIVQEHTKFDGCSFNCSEIIHPEADKEGNVKSLPYHEWIECTMYRSDREHPMTIREYLIEVRENTIPWQTKPRRMHRHKTFIQAARYAFGFAGIYDDDEGRAIVQVTDATITDAEPKIGDNGTTRLRPQKGTVRKPEIKIDPEPEPKKDDDAIDVEATVKQTEPEKTPEPTPEPKQEEAPAPKPKTTNQILKAFRTEHPDHISGKVTKDKQDVLRVKCDCGGVWLPKETAGVLVFETEKKGDGSCTEPETDEEENDENDEPVKQPEPTPAPTTKRITDGPDDEEAAQIMQLPAEQVNQFFEEKMKACGKQSLPERRKSVKPVAALIRRKLELATSPIHVQQTIQWRNRARFILTMDPELNEKLAAEINTRSKTFEK